MKEIANQPIVSRHEAQTGVHANNQRSGAVTIQSTSAYASSSSAVSSSQSESFWERSTSAYSSPVKSPKPSPSKSSKVPMLSSSHFSDMPGDAKETAAQRCARACQRIENTKFLEIHLTMHLCVFFPSGFINVRKQKFPP